MLSLAQQERLKKRILRESNVESYKHGAVITASGKIVSCGVNIRGEGFSSRFTYHAEEMAIIRLLRKRSLYRNLVLWVGRLNKDGTWGISTPCDRCAQLISWAGIKLVYHT